MRTLTLGVLIVSGGTLAALPFRRYQTIPDASAEPVQATGPTQTAIESTELRILVNAQDAQSQAELNQTLVAQLPPWSTPAEPRQTRSVNMPLTYEDLAVPVDAPAAVEQRYSATVDYREKRQPDPSTAANELIMPRIESLAVTKQDEIRSRVAVVDVEQKNSEPANRDWTGAATLASASSRAVVEKTLPDPDSDSTRQRHWIVQPD